MMPRYYFNTRIGGELIADHEGEELRDPDRAWEVARMMIQELLKTEDAESLLSAVLEVTDSDGEIVLEFPFAEGLRSLRSSWCRTLTQSVAAEKALHRCLASIPSGLTRATCKSCGCFRLRAAGKILRLSA
jgi:hypothetical protein